MATAKSETKARMKNIRAELRQMFAEKCQRMINELILEGMSDTDIGHEVGVTAQSVWNWRNGAIAPQAARADAIARVHRQVMYLRNHKVTYAELKEQNKTLEQAYEEKKDEERAA